MCIVELVLCHLSTKNVLSPIYIYANESFSPFFATNFTVNSNFSGVSFLVTCTVSICAFVVSIAAKYCTVCVNAEEQGIEIRNTNKFVTATNKRILLLILMPLHGWCKHSVGVQLTVIFFVAFENSNAENSTKLNWEKFGNFGSLMRAWLDAAMPTMPSISLSTNLFFKGACLKMVCVRWTKFFRVIPFIPEKLPTKYISPSKFWAQMKVTENHSIIIIIIIFSGDAAVCLYWNDKILIPFRCQDTTNYSGCDKILN